MELASDVRTNWILAHMECATHATTPSSTHLDNIVCRVELLHLRHKGCMDLVKHDRFLWQLLANVF